jgi:hypothetical protein
MEVSYSTYDGHGWCAWTSYAEAADDATPNDELWLVLNDNAVLGLPDNFNRLVIWPQVGDDPGDDCGDTEERRTAVLGRREFEGGWGVNDPGLLGPGAGLLTIDHVNIRTTWTSASGQVRTLYGKAP